MRLNLFSPDTGTCSVSENKKPREFLKKKATLIHQDEPQ